MPRNYYNSRKVAARLLALGLALAAVHSASAANLRFGWNSSTDPSVAGYNLAYGTSSGHYTSSVNAGNTTSATVASLTPGATYYFVVTAYDTIGLQSAPSNEVSLTVPNNIPPTVSLTSPQSGNTFPAASPINLTATASDSDGTVVKVEFYQGTNKVGESSSSPYSAVWNNPPSGSFTMTALAYDDAGAAVRSAGASIQVLTASPSSSPTPTPTPTTLTKVKPLALVPLITAGDTAKFKLVADDVVTQSTAVNYSLTGTAVAGVNYSTTGLTGQVTIPAGSRGVPLLIKTLPTRNGNKTIIVTVLPGDGYTPGRITACVKIMSR